MQDDAARIARGLSAAQRGALVAGHWNVTTHRFKDIGITESVSGVRYTCQLTPLGLSVRRYLEENPDAGDSHG